MTEREAERTNESEITVHRDKHAEGDYQHVTLVTEDYVATFHRNREEVATLLYDNLTAITEDRSEEDLIRDAIVTAKDTVAPVIKFGVPIENAVRWGCDHCGVVYDGTERDIGTPHTCPDCDVLLIREGSPTWLATTEFPDQRIFE